MVASIIAVYDFAADLGELGDPGDPVEVETAARFVAAPGPPVGQPQRYVSVRGIEVTAPGDAGADQSTGPARVASVIVTTAPATATATPDAGDDAADPPPTTPSAEESVRRAAPDPTSTTVAPTTVAPTTVVVVGDLTPADLQRLRECESGDDYQAINPAGPYLGAYQLSQVAWDDSARSAGRDDLVGVDPRDAGPANQDAIATEVWRTSGGSTWPNCGQHLPPRP